MHNLSMLRKLKSGEVTDISCYPKEGHHYTLPEDFFLPDEMDYCDAKTERWIWSIGRRKKDGVMIASLDGDLYQNDDYECLWLR
jgi:hypothetical protein